MRAFMLVTVQSLVAMLDFFTPCFIGINETKEKNNFAKLRRLITKVIGFISENFNQYDQARIIDALLYGAERHKGGRRNDKIEPYFNHCLEVLCFLIDIGVRDVDILIAAILHDTKEDGGATKRGITERFGIKVYRIVDLLSKHPNKTLEMFYYDDIRSEPDDEIRAGAIIVKCPDRAHSLRTLDGLASERKKRIRNETKREFPGLLQALAQSLSRLPPEKKQGLPDILVEDLHALVFGSLKRK